MIAGSSVSLARLGIFLGISVALLGLLEYGWSTSAHASGQVAATAKPTLVSRTPKSCQEAIRKAFFKESDGPARSISTGKSGVIDACYGALLKSGQRPSGFAKDYICTGRSGVASVTTEHVEVLTKPDLFVNIGECRIVVVEKLPDGADQRGRLLDQITQPALDEATGRWEVHGGTNTESQAFLDSLYNSKGEATPLFQAMPAPNSPSAVYDEQGNVMDNDPQEITTYALQEFASPPSMDNIFDSVDGTPLPGPIPLEYQPLDGETFFVDSDGNLRQIAQLSSNLELTQQFSSSDSAVDSYLEPDSSFSPNPAPAADFQDRWDAVYSDADSSVSAWQKFTGRIRSWWPF